MKKEQIGKRAARNEIELEFFEQDDNEKFILDMYKKDSDPEDEDENNEIYGTNSDLKGVSKSTENGIHARAGS